MHPEAEGLSRPLDEGLTFGGKGKAGAAQPPVKDAADVTGGILHLSSRRQFSPQFYAKNPPSRLVQPMDRAAVVFGWGAGAAAGSDGWARRRPGFQEMGGGLHLPLSGLFSSALPRSSSPPPP